MGLRDRERDPELPALAGEPGLRPPGPEELVQLVGSHLKRPGAPDLVDARWDYARWKPGVSITSVYTLRFADGVEEPVVAKRYVDGKERTLRGRSSDEELEPLCERLAPRALLAERSLSLWVPVADRVLRGTPALLDRRKLVRLLTRSGVAAAGTVKKRKTRYTLLRYKPERRGVWRLDLSLRGEGRSSQSLAARVLPPAEAARVGAARVALEAAGGREFTPPVAAKNLSQGFLCEPWLELEAPAPDVFGHAREAGAVLARLHALPAPAGLRRVSAGVPKDLARLLAVDAGLGRMPRAATHPPAARSVFCHGDFHPDQVVRRADGRWWLMDLDVVGAGDPALDLANWIADWIVEHERVDVEAAQGELLAGYRAAGGIVPEPAHLAGFTAAELVCRAGSALRRLERGAIEKARFALAAADEIA